MKVNVPYISRVEGHAHLVVDTDSGEVITCQLEVIETPRYFERLLVGRHYSEVAGLAARICGICSHSHTLTSLMATEDAFGIEVSRQTSDLRRLLLSGEIIQSHLAHLYFMALPDYLGLNSLLAAAQSNRELLDRALRLKQLGSDICTVVGGRPVHAVTPCVGGFHRFPEAADLQALRRRLSESLPDLEQTVELLTTLPWPEYSRQTEYVALHDVESYPLFGKTLITSGATEVPIGSYPELIREYVVEHATAKHATANGAPYMVGPLARFRQGYHRLEPLAREVADLLGLKPTTFNPYLSQGIRLVEVLQCVEQAMRLIDQLLLAGLKKDEPVPVQPIAGSGTGAVEAPRGVLLHAYRFGADGLLESADCVIPTAQNLANLETDLRTRVPEIHGRKADDFQADLERLVRAYDPCLSCSTHVLTIERR